MKGIFFIIVALVVMMICSCEPSSTEEEMGTRADTAQVQLPPGYVQVGN